MTGNDTYLLNCANLGDITVTTASGFSLYAGGISGMMTAAQYNCYSLGDVTVGTVAQADAASNAGILAGALNRILIQRSSSQNRGAVLFLDRR